MYDDKEVLIDWAWEDDEPLVTRREIHKNEPEELKKQLRGIQSRISSPLDTKANLEDSSVRGIGSACFSINASYEIHHQINEYNLPKQAIATKIKDEGRFNSPEKLYINYSYEYFDK